MKNNKIKVGSEWISVCGHEGVIKYIGDTKFFIKFTDGTEASFFIKGIEKYFKPKHKERVVWLNVYECHVSHGYKSKKEADYFQGSDRLFCQRVVIKDSDDE